MPPGTEGQVPVFSQDDLEVRVDQLDGVEGEGPAANQQNVESTLLQPQEESHHDKEFTPRVRSIVYLLTQGNRRRPLPSA